MLYLIATPIGNLSDISYRAVELLQSCDYALCEDTRHSEKILYHYKIKKHLRSYHQFNEATKEEEIIADLKKGLTICLLSDAGTPGICDPGYRLVKRCIEEGLPFTSIPGPSAFLTALILSGFPPFPFQFLGFLPKGSSEKTKVIRESLIYKGTTLFYETPHRLVNTLEIIQLLDKERKLCVMRELTKIFEERIEGTASSLLAHFQKNSPRGEMVLALSANDKSTDFLSLSPKEHVDLLQKEYSLSLQEAIKMAASLRQVPKREIYQEIHRK